MFEVNNPVLVQNSTTISILWNVGLGESFQNFIIDYWYSLLILRRILWILGAYFVNEKFLNKNNYIWRKLGQRVGVVNHNSKHIELRQYDIYG